MIAYHGTSKYCANKIKKEGFSFNKGRIKKRSRMYGNAISFTDNLELAKRFGDAIIEVDISKAKLFKMKIEPNDDNKESFGKSLINKGYDGILFDDKKWGTKCREYMIFNISKISIK